MASINDLRTNTEDTGSGISNPVVEEKETVSVKETTGSKEGRVIADLSTLPQETEVPGVTVKEGDIVDEIFAPGGDFDKYRENKMKEFQAVCDLIDQHNEMVAIERGEEVPDNDSITNKDMSAVLAGTEYETIYNKGKVKFNRPDNILSINKDEEEELDPVEKEMLNDDVYGVNVFDHNPERKIVPLEEQLQPKKDYHDNLEKAVMNPINNVSFDIDDEDFDDIASASKDDIDEDAEFEALQASISEKIKPVSNKLDLSTFTVKNTPVTVNGNILSAQLAADAHVADWVLMSSRVHFGMKEFTGKDIEKLGDTSAANRFTMMKNRYKLFYDHLADPKPETLEQWLKSISFLDNDHLYFGLFMANFAGANYLPYDCPHCKHTFLSENIDIDKMYKIKNDESKKLFEKIRNSELGECNGTYVSEIVPFTSKFAIGFRDPSIYSVIIENSMLDEKFATKYQDIISVIAYIDNIYVIDEATRSLNPVNYKVDPNNTVYTIKSKILTYSKILSSFSPDQYNTLLAYMNAINRRSDDITYVKPEVTCPKCHKVIEETTIGAEALVFQRAQLAALGLTSIK